MAGKLTIRSGDPQADRSRIAEVLARNLPQAAAPERLEWLYLGGPNGRSLVWLAEDEATHAIAGTSAAHVRTFRIDGRDAKVLNLSDFAIDAGYRTLGPALGLLRATLDAVDSGDYALSYDVPSASMLALYRRLGYVELGRMQRWVRPLSLKPILERSAGAMGRLLGPFADAALHVRDAAGITPAGVRITPLDGDYGAEFDELDAEQADRLPVRGARSAAYLNWRYARHAMWSHGALCARRGGKLLGFLVWRQAEPGIVSIAELVAGEPAVARALVRSLTAVAREKKAISLSVQVLAGSPAVDLFRQTRFFMRDEGPGPVVYTPEGSPVGDLVADARNWWFLEGDRDI